VAQALEGLLCKHAVLSLNPNTEEEKNHKNQKTLKEANTAKLRVNTLISVNQDAPIFISVWTDKTSCLE
jgi:hypothetical protein